MAGETGILSRPDLYTVTATAANSELGAVVYSAFTAANVWSLRLLHDKVMSMQGDEPIWLDMAPVTPFQNCEIFTNYGLVSKSDAQRRVYQLADFGRIALPTVGNLVDLSLTSELPLQAYFGSRPINKAGPYASERRIRLIEFLSNTDGQRQTIQSAREAAGISPRGIRDLIDNLALHGIVSSSFTERGKSSVTFEITSDINYIELSDQANELTRSIVTILQNLYTANPDTRVTNEAITEMLIEQDSSIDREGLLAYVARKTNYLVKRWQVLQPKYAFDQQNVRSVVWATEPQLIVIEGVLKALGIKGRGMREYRDRGIEVLDSIANNSDQVNRLLAKYLLNSYHQKAVPEGQVNTLSAINVVLQEQVEPLTVRQVWEQLASRSIKLDLASVQVHLRVLAEARAIEVTSSPQGQRYLVKEEAE